MKILRSVRPFVLSCLLCFGAGLCGARWALPADAQEAPEASGKEEHVISPEQQELLADMLGRGATLEGCQMGNGEVDRTVVNVVYACPNGEVAVQLVHPSQAPSGATQTDRFAITLQSGNPPEGLLPALASRIRAKEAGFEWKVVGGTDASAGLFTRSQHDSEGSASMSVSWVRLGVASLLGIGVVWWILRRMAARKKAH